MSWLGILYQISTAWLAIYSLNSLLLSLTYLRARRGTPPTHAPAVWPSVTIQLPIYNELHVAERAIMAANRIDYPRDLLQIQVLDDSTDETAGLVRQAVLRSASSGRDIVHLHRTHRTGFKAGALAQGSLSATGEFVAVFDADFVPQPDFLRRILPYFSSPDVGCVQGRWGHLNRYCSTLTQAQALGIDGHFGIEQRVRSDSGLFLNFNGSAGVWRRSCIDDAGGWQTDTLAEDLDLSYRAQLAGWKIVFARDVCAPAELPPQLDALRRQQARWAQGSIRVAIKLLPALLRSGESWLVKAEGAIHLTGYLVHPLLLATLLLTAATIFGAQQFPTIPPYYLLGTAGPTLMYLVAEAGQAESRWQRARLAPLLMLLGVGLALNNSMAIAKSLLCRRSEFLRTPKFDVNGSGDQWRGSAYALRCSTLVWGELVLTMLSWCAAWTQWQRTGVFSLWLAVYGLSFAYVALTSLLQAWQTQRARVESRSSDRRGEVLAGIRGEESRACGRSRNLGQGSGQSHFETGGESPWPRAATDRVPGVRVSHGGSAGQHDWPMGKRRSGDLWS